MQKIFPVLCALTLWGADRLTSAEELPPPCLAADPSREADFLHRRLDKSRFTNLRIWDPKTKNWEDVEGAPFDTQAKLVILHFWSDDCPPCIREMPSLRQLALRLAKQYGRQVQILYLSESLTLEGAQRFFETSGKHTPAGAQYHDTGGVLRMALSSDTGRTMPLPTTLVMDEQLKVRHAIIGPIDTRESELRGAIERLMTIREPS